MLRFKVDENLPKEVAELLREPPAEHHGIIILRLDHQDKATVLSVVAGMLPLLAAEDVKEKLWIVEPDRVRIWRDWE